MGESAAGGNVANWLLPFLSGVVGLLSALLVSWLERYRLQSNAAAFIRLRLDSYVKEVERLYEAAETRIEEGDAAVEAPWALVGVSLLEDPPKVDPLLEGRLTEVIGVNDHLDRHLTRFYEKAGSGTSQLTRIRDQHPSAQVAVLKDGRRVRRAVNEFPGAASEAVLARRPLNDLFGGIGGIWGRVKDWAGRYSVLHTDEDEKSVEFMRNQLVAFGATEDTDGS